MWIRLDPDDIGTTVVLYSCYQWAGLVLKSDGKVYFLNDSEATIANSSTTISDSNWHHVVITKSGSTTKIYIDGQDVTVVGTDTTLGDTAYWPTIAYRWENHGTYPKGLCENGGVSRWASFYRYSTALSSDRVAAHYATTGGARTIDYVVQLVDNTTVLYTWNHNAVSGLTTYEQTVTLTNYNNLRLRVQAVIT